MTKQDQELYLYMVKSLENDLINNRINLDQFSNTLKETRDIFNIKVGA